MENSSEKIGIWKNEADLGLGPTRNGGGGSSGRRG